MPFQSVYAYTDATRIDVLVENCNNDSICEPLMGENYWGCPLDCDPPPPTPTPTSTPTAIPPEDTAYGASIYPDKVASDVWDLTPTNVAFIRISVLGKNVKISWINPENKAFNGVVVLRSPYFYPQDPLEGKIIYEGKGTTFTQSDLKPGTDYFYTIFTKSKAGNYSSGALLHLRVGGGVTPTPYPSNVPPKNTPTPTKNNGTGTVGGLKNLTLSDFQFIQNNKTISVVKGQVVVERGVTLFVQVQPSKILQQDLSTVLISMQDPDAKGSFNTFLLSLKKVKGKGDVLEATIPPFRTVGKVTFALNVFRDRKRTFNQVYGVFDIKTTKTEIKATSKSQSTVLTNVINRFKLFILSNVR